MKRKELFSYLLLLLVLTLEVTVFFEAVEFAIPQFLSLIPLVLIGVLFWQKGYFFGKKVVVALSVLVFLILVQGVLFGVSIVTLITYPLFVLLTPYMLYKVVGNKVFHYLVNVIFYTALLSSAIWFLQFLFPPVNSFMQYLRLFSDLSLIKGDEVGHRVSIGFIYTISHWYVNIGGLDILRNSGMYHEPGAFAYFLILGMGVNTIITNSFFNRKNIVFMAMLLTTFSTAGYLSLFIILTYVVFKGRLNPALKILVILGFVAISTLSYTRLDFMQEKIVDQYETRIDDGSAFGGGEGRAYRIRSALNLLSTSPIIGRGIITASRDFQPGSPYYFTGAGAWRTLASYGILFTPVIFFLFYRGIRNLCILNGYHKGFALFFFLAILVGATAQRFFTDNITMLFFVFGLLYNIQVQNNKKSHPVQP